MSLINDALKRAQKQRTGEAPPLASMPSIGGESPVHIAKRSKPAGFNTLFLRLGIGAGALVIVLGLGAWFTFRKPEPRHLKPEASAHPTSASGTAATPPQTATPTTKSSDAPVFNLPIASPAVVPPAPEASKPEPVTVAAPPVATKAQPTSPAAKEPAIGLATAGTANQPAPAPAAKMGSKAVVYIESLRVAGIRASATDSKVLMNDRVYRIGDIVEHEMGLKLTGITSSSLTFEDERGARYTRNF